MPEGISVGAAVVAVKTAYDTSKKVFEASKTLANAELKLLIAELAQQLAEANLQMAELKTSMVHLQEENAALRGKKEEGKPTMKWGCYQFEGEEGLFCPKCWETKGKKYHTNRAEHGTAFQCTVCGTKFPTR